VEEGIAQIHQGIARYQATGAEVERSYFLGLLAEAYGKIGQTEEGLRVLAEALAEVDRHGDHTLALKGRQQEFSGGESCCPNHPC